MNRIKFFIVCILTLLISTSSFAASRAPEDRASINLLRTGTNEISLSYGQGSIGQGIYLFADVFAVIFSLGHASAKDPVFTGEVSTEYYHYLNNVVAVGGILTGEYMGGNMVDQNKPEDDPNYVNGKFEMGFVSLMPAAKFSWFNHNHVGMYSKVGVGCSLVLGGSESIQPMVAFQLSPVCCDFGNDSWRGFAELGVGTQGILNLGIKYQF